MARLALVAAGGLARVVLIDVRPDVDKRHAFAIMQLPTASEAGGAV